MDKAQYYNADYILVGSNYVKNSFIDNGFPSERIIVNNYGMRLDYFKPTKLDSKEPLSKMEIAPKCFFIIFIVWQ